MVVILMATDTDSLINLMTRCGNKNGLSLPVAWRAFMLKQRLELKVYEGGGVFSALFVLH